VLGPHDVVIFSDSQIAVKAIDDMTNTSRSSGIWHAFAPLLSRFTRVTIRWIPGHVGILGNELTDRLAKRACQLALEPGRWANIDFGFSSYARIRERRLTQWRSWHTAEGHSYYRGVPRDFRHLRSMTRLDLFALIRVRSGTGMVGHDDCPNNTDRHHWVLCDRYTDRRPAFETLYDFSKSSMWVDWIRHHDMLGLGIPANARREGNVTIAFGNPFDGTACIVRDGRRIVVDIALPTYRCDDCGLVHANPGCSLPAFHMAHSYYFMAPGSTTCPVCSAHVPDNKQGRNRHFGKDTPCKEKGQQWFWHGVRLLWTRISPAEKLKLAIKWLYPIHSKDSVTCLGCQAVFGGSHKWLSHLRLEKNDGCWPTVWVKFLSDCDVVGDDADKAKLLIFGILGWDEEV